MSRTTPQPLTPFALTAFVGGLVIVTVLGLVDLAASFSLMGGLLFGVIIAATASTPTQVGLVGIYAVIWGLALGVEGDHWTDAHWLRLGILLAGSALAVIATATRQRYLTALVRAANVATVAQRALLRPLEERYDGAELAVRYVSASDGALIGGDVYDAEVTPWGLRILVADVCGHGLEAVEAASSLVFAFREAAHLRPTVAELARALDSSFRRVTAGRPDFASGILLQITGNHVEVANCGHPDPILVNAGHLDWLTPSRRSRPFGLGPAPATTRRRLLSDDRLLVYTDGLTEARDASGQFFDVGTHVVAAFGASSLDDALDVLLRQLRRHTGDTFRDDVVLFALRAV